ncbi:DNA polymerase I [Rhodovastum atsumiense]|uniref:DNA polymerase I n=1 Tax=Rhodovastum atsumiense TaxID=504468 RepID=A0A5M6IPW4_9PROT|nr:DNA polymerase I [Rhodovastum atsumiense]KAA5610322.1 DNA polymerase I [Rhodovastum atsumiense]CAH2600940.1 DNA polymerase I [Rhodovastum atsumiense]
MCSRRARAAATTTDVSPSAEAVATPPHLVLIDGSGFIFRAFHALPPMTRPDGTPVNAVFGFTNMLAKLVKEHVGTHLAVIFDAGRITFRNELYDLYKAQRPEPPEELRPQFALVRDATAAFGVPAIELAGWEADDLIASYARCVREAGGRATIVSSDKDLMQLIRPGVDMLDPIKQKPIGPAEVMEKWGVAPEKLVEVQALMGDAVDNVPGVPGIGPKTAAQLVTEYGDLEAVLAAAPGMKASKKRDSLIAHAEAARLSRRLVELRADAPLPTPLEALVVRQPDRDRLATWLREQGFRSTVVRLGLEDQAPAAMAPPPTAAPRTAGQGMLAFAETPASPVPVPAGGPGAAYGPYETVTTLAALQSWIAEATAAGVVALDTETDGLDAMRAALVGFSLATAPGRACYVPLRHEGVAEQVPVAEAIAALAPLLVDAGVLKVFQNAKFDMMILARAGAPLAAPLDDSMLISYAQEAGRHGHGMDELALLHLQHSCISYDSVTGTGRARVPFTQVPLERATPYAAEDADVTLRLWRTLRPELRVTKSLALYEQVERRLIPVLLEMERAGVKVDADDLRAMSKDFEARMATMEAEIHRLAGSAFNVGSPKQLGEVLFDHMQLPGGKRMKTGAWGTDSSVLQGLAEKGHELPARVLEWRQLQKLKSTYADALVGQINPETGRVHTSFAMAITSTGRLSSTDPNLQNIPIRTEEGSRIRRAFVAETGNVLISADYSQIELRLLAHVADIPALKESFAAGEDIHARTASEVFGIPMAGMDPMTRRRAKAINFGIIYGISAFGLGRQLGIEPGEARAYIDAYFARYPGIRAYMEKTKEEARIAGYVTTPFGRRCWIPGIDEKNGMRRAYAERQAINAPLQGGAADIIKRAMVRLPAALREAGLCARLLLQVHDELLFEAPQAEAEATARLAREVMEAAATLSVPLVVETGIGRSWAEAH